VPLNLSDQYKKVPKSDLEMFFSSLSNILRFSQSPISRESLISNVDLTSWYLWHLFLESPSAMLGALTFIIQYLTYTL